MSRRRLAIDVVLAGLFGLALAAATTAVRGVPRPAFHDEASYLLAADTFAHGRLANPTPRHPERLWALHVLMEPTYASKYPPGQGLALAAGTVLAGRPIAGVWLSIALLAAGVTAALGGFVPRRWAFLGGVLVAAHFGGPTYWSQSYWGGALTAAGGAWTLAAAAALRRRPSALAGAGFGLGLGGLAATRPYEGLAFALVVLGWLLRRGSIGALLRRAALPAAAVGGTILAGLVYQAYRVTGEVGVLPYSLYARQVEPVPTFAFEPLRPLPAGLNDAFTRLYGRWATAEYERQLPLGGRLRHYRHRLALAGRVLLGPVLVVLVAIALADLRRRRRGTGLAVAGLGVSLLASALVVYYRPHYSAPIVVLLMLLAVQGWRRLAVRPGRRGRRRAAIAAVLVAVAVERSLYVDTALAQAGPESAAAARAGIEERLRREGGRSLVLVSLGPHADPHVLWVANGADPESQEVLWGWSLDPAADRALVADYPDRVGWRLSVGEGSRGALEMERIAAEP